MLPHKYILKKLTTNLKVNLLNPKSGLRHYHDADNPTLIQNYLKAA